MFTIPSSKNKNFVICRPCMFRPKLTSGPVWITVFLLRDCALIIAEPISKHSKLFNLFLQMDTYPSQWKYFKITPVSKKGKRFYDYRDFIWVC